MNKRPANQRLMQAVRSLCGRRSGLSAPAVALLGFSVVSVALAGPTGGVVVDGQATISTPAVGTTVIDQASQHVQLNWNTFDVGANESVQFQQPNSSSVALNRILDQNPSQIFGRIDANGQVILVNPNGMLFGASAQLNVGSLVASSLDVIGFDAATGRYTFGTSRTDVGAIVNEGAITAAGGGSVTLLGGRVSNTGSIIANFGTVNLAAGRAATLDLAGDGLLRLEVDGELISNNDGAGAAVENSGVIEANGGQVLLTAQAVDDVFANLVNNTGVVRANRIDNSGGTIRLMGAGGTVRSSGVLDASAGDVVSSGGTVEMLGEQVGLFGAALVDVSGATNGGTALIGGDYQGKNPDVLNAARTYVSSDASIRADAGLTGDGGRVIVWADEITRFNGSISARGGASSGNGGFAEVSGKETLLFRGSANLSAANGFAGELLLDPRNIIVATGGEGDLAGGTGDDGVANDYAFAEDAADDITIAPTTITDILDTGTTVTLQAHNDITVTDAIDGSASTTSGGGLIFQAGDDIFINADIRTNDGAIQFTAGDDAATPTGANGDEAPTGEMTLASGVTLSAGAAAVTLNSDGNMQLLGTVSGNAITAVSGGALTVGTLDAGAGSVNLTATGSIVDDGDNTTRIAADTLTMSAGTVIGAIGATGQIDTNVTSLTASAGEMGVFVGELNGLALTDVSVADFGQVHVTSTTGDIVVGTVTAPNGVTLVASGGAITDDGNNATRIATQMLSLGASGAVGATGATGQIDTDVTSLGVNSAGSVYIGELNDITLSSVTATGDDTDIVVTSTGDVVVRAVAAANAVTLTSTAGSITDDGLDTTNIYAGTLLTLNAGGAIGASGASGQLDTDVTSLSASAGAGGVYISDSNGGLTLTDVSASGAGSDVNVTSQTGNIVVGTVTATDNVTLTATTGAITDDGDDATRIASSGTLTLSAGTAIGATGVTGQIDTDVTSLTAAASAGGVYIAEANGLTLTNVSAAGAGNDVSVTNATGDIVVGTVAASDDVTLTAVVGAIIDDSDNATRITAQTLDLSAGTAIGAAGASGQIDTDVTSLDADASVGSIYIGELNGLSLTRAAAVGGVGDDVVVTSTTGNIVVGIVHAADTVTLTATAGAITDDNSNVTRINAETLSLSAGTAIGASATDGQIDTNVVSLSATAAAGGVYIGETNGVALTNVSAAGAGSDVSVTSTTGTIVVGSVTANDTVALAATAGAIADDGDNATRITAGAATLTAGTAIGAAGANAEVDTDVASLTATAGAGGVYIGESNAIMLSNVSATGAGNDVSVTSATGDIQVGNVSADDAVTLTATARNITDDGDNATRINAGTVTLNAGMAVGASGATGQIDTNVTSLTAAATAGGVYVGELNGVTLTNVSSGGAGGQVNVTSTTGDIVVNTVSASNMVTLTAAAGAITDDDDNATRISTGALTLNAGTAIGATGATGEIDTNVDALTAIADDGGVYVGESNSVTLTDVRAAGAGNDVNVTNTTGNMLVSNVSAADAVTLTAVGGAIVDDTLDATRISAGTLMMTAATGIGASGGSNQIDTNVTSLTASVGNGGVYIGEANGLTLTSVSTGGVGHDVEVTSATGDIVVNTVTAADDVTLTATAGDIVVTSITAVDAVTLTATAGSIVDDGVDTTRIVGGNLALSAGTAIGATGANGQIDTEVTALTASAGAGGVYLGEVDGLTLTNVSAAGAGSDVNVFSATGDVVVNTVTAADEVTLTLSTGSILDDGANATRINAETLTLSARNIGATGATGQIDTNVASLTATAWAGGVYIGEQNGLTLTNVSAAGAGNDVNVTSATGDIVVNTVTAPDAVTLTATAGDIVVGNIGAAGAVTLAAAAGSITDDDNDATVIAGGSVSLSAATNVGTVVDFEAVDDADVGSSLDVQTTGALTATVTSDNGQINLNISGTPILAAGAITLGSGSNRAGAIVLQSAGDLNVGGFAPGAINIGSDNTTQLGLRSGDVLTLPSSGGFTDQPADHLLVRGATEIVDNDAAPRELTLAATALDFRSGATNGATILNTTVDRLSATIGNDQNLTVNETNGLTLGTLDVGNGNITLNALGAVTDDGDNSTRIVSNTASLSGTSFGAAGNALDTQVNTLTASATSGGVYISEADALAVTVSATGGAADVRTANGSLTVAAASGTGVTLIAGGAGSDITLDGSVNAGTGDVTLTAGTAASRGAIVAGAGSQITGDALTATGSTIGAGATRLSTTVASVNATSTNGGIYITESDAVSLAANASGGAVDVRTTNGAITVTQATGDGVALAAGGAGNGITVNGAVNAGAGNVILDAGTAASRGAIVAGAGNQITGDILVMSGSTIGTGAARLNTSVNSLNATSTNGGMFITEADALNLTASATNGIADVRTTNGALTVTLARGDGVTLIAGGAGNGITLSGDVNAGAGDVTLTAGTPASGGAIVAVGASQITGGSLTASGSTVGTSAARLNTTVASIDATSTNGGIFITETDALNLSASATGGAVDVQTGNGSLTVAAVSGDGVTLTAGGAGSNITLNDTVNAGAGDVTLTAGTAASRGAIVGGAGNQVIGGSLTATGTTIGTSAARLNTNVASLAATSTNGGIFITEADSLDVTASATGGAVDVQTGNGSLTIAAASGDGVTLIAGGAGNGIALNGAVNAGAGNVTLTAGTAASRGAILAGAGNQITGNSLTASGSTIGTADARMNTTVASLDATSTSGGIFIGETDALSLAASAIGGAVDVQTGNGSLSVAAVNGDGVTLTAGGAGSAITLNGAVNAGVGDVTLTAGTSASRGAIVGAAGHSIAGRSLTASATTIGASNARLNTSIDTLNATASTGDVYISEQNGLTLANVSAARDIDVSSVAGDIVVNTVAAADDVTLTATSGAIADDGEDSTRLVANSLTLSARSVGAASTLSGTTLNSSARLDTDVETLNVTASAGGIFIDEADGLQSVNVQASGGDDGDIELLTSAGDLILDHVSASDTLLLAAGRNIFAAPGAGPVTARRAELRAGTTDPAGGQIGRLSDSIELQLSAGNSLRLFVPQTIDPNDANRAPAVEPSLGVNATLNQFAAQGSLAALAGFNQLQGLGEIEFTSPAESLVRSLQSQTGTVQSGLDIDWGSFDPDVSLFGTLEPSVCLPADQRDEESSTPDC